MSEITIRFANEQDLAFLDATDRHIKEDQIRKKVADKEILIAAIDDNQLGLLRWNYFWDLIPFMNLLWIHPMYHRRGFGRRLVLEWERLMREAGYEAVMTSTLSDELAQNFYRAIDYKDQGVLLLPDEAAELIFYKRFNK